MDELLCTESSIPPGSSDEQTNSQTDNNQPTCSYDATIFSDERVLDNLLLAQSLSQPSDQFLQPNKSNVTPNIRAVLVNWMLEVSSTFLLISKRCLRVAVAWETNFFGLTIKLFSVAHVYS
jgi:hypothetical protein